MDATWEILFTPDFRKDLRSLPQEKAQAFLKKLERLQTDPYAPNPNIKRLKGKDHARSFRWRIGDWRSIYRIADSAKEIFLLSAGPRGKIYSKSLPNVDRDITGFLNHENPLQTSGETLKNQPPPAEAHAEQIYDEEIECILITPEELHLIGIPDRHHESILRAGTMENLYREELPEAVAARVEDYITAPSQTHVGKLYKLGPQQGLSAIASESLSSFLLALDPQQREIVDKSLDGGPYLVRGGPGTGKTLICLHRLREIYLRRATESLFDQKDPYYLFVTYNRSLAISNEGFFTNLQNDLQNVALRFKTLDQIIYSVCEMRKGHFDKSLQYSLAKDDQLDSIIEEHVLPEVQKSNGNSKTLQRLLSTYSVHFFREEFEDVIRGNTLIDDTQYYEFTRTGRKTPLGRRQREIIWEMYEMYTQQLLTKRLQSWEGKRLQLLLELEKTKEPLFRRADAAVIDEVQDLSATAIRLLLHFVKDTRFLMFSADSGQSIYSTNPSWKNISNKLRFAGGRSFILRKSYRMTKEIHQATAPLRLDTDKDDDASVSFQPVFTGPEPIWIRAPIHEHADRTIEILHYLIRKQQVNPNQIAIICRYKGQTQEILKAVEAGGLKANLLDRNTPLEINAPVLTILNVHASKGLEFPFVIIPFLKDSIYPNSIALKECRDQTEKEECLNKEQSILYVAMTRGSRRIWIVSDPRNPSRFLDLLDERHWRIAN